MDFPFVIYLEIDTDISASFTVNNNHRVNREHSGRGRWGLLFQVAQE